MLRIGVFIQRHAPPILFACSCVHAAGALIFVGRAREPEFRGRKFIFGLEPFLEQSRTSGIGGLRLEQWNECPALSS